MRKQLKIVSTLSAFALGIILFADGDAISQSVPFNAFSVTTLGGNCSQHGAVLFQSSGGQSKCLTAGTAGRFLQANGAGADVSWSGIVPGTGTVTSIGIIAPAEISVAGSPVTVSGDITLAWATAAANVIFAGPTGGAPATPAFRALVAADLPTLTGAMFGSQSANTFLGAPNGASGNPTFRPLVAADIPDLVPTLANNLTATGTNQGTALAITADFSHVTTAASGTGVILPAAVTGQTLEVKNSGLNSLNVYPPSSQSIDAFALNAAVTIFPGAAARFTFDGSTNWISR